MSNVLFDALLAPRATAEDVFLDLDDGKAVTYRALAARSAQMAHVLRASGVEVGDRVVAQVPKVADAVALYLGCVRAGAVYLPLNTAYTVDEVAYFVGDAEPALIVCDPEREGALSDLARQSGAALLTLGRTGGSLPRAADASPESFDTTPRGRDDLAALLYTSGTTGRSKGAMMSHRNLLSNARALVELWRISSDDRLIHALPIFHTHGLFVALNTSLLAGARVRFMERFDIDAILEEMPSSSMLMGVPTFYTRLLQDERFTPERSENMRVFISGSAPLLAETHEAFEARSGHRILERYGMTETNMITSNPYEGGRVAGTVGFPLPGCEVRITDVESAEQKSRGEVGMIEVRGENVFQGYWRMPEKTAEELREDGFFITGDLGVMDDEGRVSIVGRAKDLIISGGYNIYPKEIEDVLNRIDGIGESAVFGVPDSDFGEAVLAALVKGDGPSPSTESIEAHVAGRLAKFKRPRRYLWLDELPRNTMGKVQKNLLRERFSDQSVSNT